MLDIHFYAIKGKTEEMKLLFKGKEPREDINSIASVTGSTPLLLASAGGHTDIVSLLLQKGADPTKCSFSGQSPLLVAIVGLLSDSSNIPKENFYIIIKMLLRKNIDLIELKNDKCPTTPFDMIQEWPEIKERILAIIKEIQPDHHLLKSSNPSPTQEETQKEASSIGSESQPAFLQQRRQQLPIVTHQPQFTATTKSPKQQTYPKLLSFFWQILNPMNKAPQEEEQPLLEQSSNVIKKNQ